MSTTTFLSTELIEGHQARFELDAAELEVTAGKDRGQRIALGADALLIGTSPTAQLVLHDETVSARHAEIVVDGQRYSVRDLGSKNGVRIGAVTIERAPLVDGMRLHLGSTTLRVRSLKKRQSIALAAAGAFGNLIAYSMRMRAVVAQLEQLASSDMTVLIEGETGTGKEMAAQALHMHSARARGPFVVFDCGVAQPALAAAELFGHEKGAFTDASGPRAGLLEEAEGGTLFLDEIGELPLNLQPLLLGVLERRSSRRIGGQHDLKHDLRIIAATNRNLAEEVREKRFREDLFFRLSVTRVRLPPLRERLEDIPLLADSFAEELGLRLPREARSLLGTREWPGNVRELRNTVAQIAVHPEQAVEIVGAQGPLEPAFDRCGQIRPLTEARRRAVEEFERRYVEQILAETQGNVTRAAELAQVTRRCLQLLGAKYGLRRSDSNS
jgi:DNA-binding NtrC family response regulator